MKGEVSRIALAGKASQNQVTESLIPANPTHKAQTDPRDARSKLGHPSAAQPALDLRSRKQQSPGSRKAFSLPHPQGFLMSLVFSSNHSSYNTELGEAKNSSPSHVTAPNAEAPSKGTSATPCFLGNESHRDAWAAAATNAARAAHRHFVSCDSPAVTGTGWGRKGRPPPQS